MTFTGTSANGQDAAIPAVHYGRGKGLSSTLNRRSRVLTAATADLSERSPIASGHVWVADARIRLPHPREVIRGPGGCARVSCCPGFRERYATAHIHAPARRHCGLAARGARAAEADASDGIHR